jgi:hypothetical protein
MLARPFTEEKSMNLRVLRAAALAASMLAALPAAAQFSGDGLKNVLGNASDAALDKLSKPGAFSADDAIRIALPGQSKGVGDLLKLADRAGVTNDIGGSLNRAAEQAAAQAKPIFRNAIDRLSLKDTVGIATGGNTAATDYLRKSSSSEILAKLTPLVKAALAQSGVLRQTSQLSSLGLTEEKLTGYVAQKTSDGIFTYVGREETQMRQNPVESGRAILKGLKF